MITAHKKNHAKRISGSTKLNIALQAIPRKQFLSQNRVSAKNSAF